MTGTPARARATRRRGSPCPAPVSRLLLLVGGLLLAAFVTAAPAAAHASLVQSEPADGARLAATPHAVSVTFDEGVGLQPGGYLHVVDQAGRRVDTGPVSQPDGNPATVSVALATGVGRGTFTVSYRIISADSHPVAGAVRFVVGDGALSPLASGAVTTTDPATADLFDVARWVGYAGLALLGGLWLVATAWPAGRDDPGTKRLLATGWVLALAGTLADVLLQGPYAAGRGPGAVLDRSLLDGTLRTGFGQAHGVRLLLLAVLGGLLAALFRRVTTWHRARIPLALLGGGLLLSWGLVGHPATEQPVWISVPSVVLHLAAMAAWLGGLVLLVARVLPRDEPGELAAALPAVSRVSFGAVTVLALTGAYQAWRGVGTAGALLTTGYGRLVLTKTVLFVVVVAVANLSRQSVQRRARARVAYALTDASADLEPIRPAGLVPGRGPRLRRTVGIELGLAAAVLAATAVLVNQPPGASAAGQQAATAPATVRVDLGGGRTAVFTVTPAHHGPVAVTLSLPGPAPLALTATAALPARQLGPLTIPLTGPNISSTGAVTYRVTGLLLPAAGRWTVTLTVRTGRFDATTANTTLPIT